jgi:hypothetical protein
MLKLIAHSSSRTIKDGPTVALSEICKRPVLLAGISLRPGGIRRARLVLTLDMQGQGEIGVFHPRPDSRLWT